jgi:filamentous hemagglutinin
VNLTNLTGVYRADERLANAVVGLKSTPKGYVWHHVEDGVTLQLIPKSLNNSVKHTGGAAVIRNGGFDQ